jgi:ATP-dependent DNA helicase RecQ
LPAFCAGYFPGDLLFDICGLKGSAEPVVSFVSNTFAVLTRGAPTRPSSKLIELMQLDANAWDALASDPLFLMGEETPAWDRTVLGAPDGYNPAFEFITDILPTKLLDWSFVQHLIVPEYPLFRALNAPGNLILGPNDERVDFYLPQADLVIEIDGGPHREPRQAWKDRDRDRYLEGFGILTLRLATNDLRKRNDVFDNFFERLKRRCAESPRLQPYRKISISRGYSVSSPRYDMTAAIRFQIALMVTISHRQLDLADSEWKLRITQDFPCNGEFNWAEVAVEELMDWFALFARLAHVKFNPPKVIFTEEGLQFDIRIFDRPDDKVLPSDAISVRTSAVQDLPFASRGRQPLEILRVQDLGVSYLDCFDYKDSPVQQPAVADLTDLCRRIFGHNSFRPGQEALILNALSGQKSLGLMPTGGGKSLCFQLPALLGPGTTVTVVPIKALGRDHVAELEAVGFTGRVVNIDSDMSAPLRDRIYGGRIRRGEMRFIFVSPERFQVAQFRDLVMSLKSSGQLRMFVIDEVHCLSEWGHDFRPSYLTLPGTLHELARDVPVLGLTATASVNVLRDIQSEFQIPDELVAYEMHRSRSELNFLIRKELSSPSQIGTAVGNIVRSGKGNLPPPIHVFARYANGIMGVETYATTLSNTGLGLRVGSFSGTTPKDFEPKGAFKRLQSPDIPQPETYEDYKKSVQVLWKAGKLDVIVTTKAFGMGVNKPDVRHTLHAGMPSSMEAFYQEAGRAGRDRQPAFCHMLLRPEPDDAGLIYERLRNDLTPGAIEHAMSVDSDDNALHRNRRGDFRAQLWFLSQGLIDIEAEEALVTHLQQILRLTPGETVPVQAADLAHLPLGAERLQLTLYRLYQMGLIAPWTVTDWGRGEAENTSVQAVEVRSLPITFSAACENVAVRIQSIDGRNADIASLQRLRTLAVEGDAWPFLVRILLTWVRRKHLDSRLQSTWNLYSKSLAFTDDRAGVFREELEAFFKVDSNAFQLAALRDMGPEEVAKGLESILSEDTGSGVKDKTVLRKLSAQLSRLLEGTQDSPGLNVAAAILALLTEDSPESLARLRFDAARTGGALNYWLGPGRSLLTLVASGNPIAREVIGTWLLQDGPDRQTLLAVYDAIPARAVEVALFDDFAAAVDATV